VPVALTDPRKPEITLADLEPRSYTPPKNKGARDDRIPEINRDSVVVRAAEASWDHSPAIGSTIFIEPSAHLGNPFSKTGGREAEFKTEREDELAITGYDLGVVDGGLGVRRSTLGEALPSITSAYCHRSTTHAPLSHGRMHGSL
jgi:hypothetical protein